MTEQTRTRKPTRAQIKLLQAAVADQDQHSREVADLWATGARRDVVRRMVEQGLVADAGSRDLTRAGYIAANRADRFALPQVKVGDLLRYVTHTGCVVRVRAVLSGGRVFTATYVSVCAVCEQAVNRDIDYPLAPHTVRREPRHSHANPHTLDGQPAPGWRTPAYLVETVPVRDAEQIEREIERTAAVYKATKAAYANGVPGVQFPAMLYVDTIRPVYLAEWCQRCNIDFWGTSGSASERNAAHRAYHAAAEQPAAVERAEVGADGCGCPITEEVFAGGSSVEGTERTEHRSGCRNAPGTAQQLGNLVVVATVAPRELNEWTGYALARDGATWTIEGIVGKSGDIVRVGIAPPLDSGMKPETVELLDAALVDIYGPAPVSPDLPATPRFPAGTSEYERYAAELTAELRKWQRGESPEYGDAEPETAYARLSEEYGQGENDNDRNPSHVGFDQWLAEQVERLRVQVAARDAARRAGLGVVDIARVYGAQLVNGDRAGAAAALNALQNHVGGLLAALALAGGEQVAAMRNERDGAVTAWRDLSTQLEIIERREMARLAGEQWADVPAPLAVGDRVTWGGRELGENGNRELYVWTVTRVWLAPADGDRPAHWAVAVRLNGGTGKTRSAAPAEQFHKLPAMPDEHSVITFGYDHTHPDTGARLGKAFVRIPGEGELARARALALFGPDWAFDYRADRFAEQGQVEKYGLIEVAPPSEAAGLARLNDAQQAYVERQIAAHELDRLASSLRYGTDGR